MVQKGVLERSGLSWSSGLSYKIAKNVLNRYWVLTVGAYSSESFSKKGYKFSEHWMVNTVPLLAPLKRFIPQKNDISPRTTSTLTSIVDVPLFVPLFSRYCFCNNERVSFQSHQQPSQYDIRGLLYIILKFVSIF